LDGEAMAARGDEDREVAGGVRAPGFRSPPRMVEDRKALSVEPR
jgi:hypothetical protein